MKPPKTSKFWLIFNVQFVLCVKYLIRYKHVKNKAKLSEEIGSNKADLSKMLNGSRNPTIQQFAIMVEKYNLDSEFFIKTNRARKELIFKRKQRHGKNHRI